MDGFSWFILRPSQRYASSVSLHFLKIWGFQLLKKERKSGFPLLGTGGAESGSGWVVSM